MAFFVNRDEKVTLADQVAVQETFWVVGIGASAGGLEALTRLVTALPTNSNACYVVAHHLAPHAKSMMVELISKQSPIPVDVVTNKMLLQPNKVFIVPPNFDVDVRDQQLILTKAGEETRPKPSVDRFFNSLAAHYGHRAIGIILSGTGSDGAQGIREIKSHGGVTIAQEESSAKFAGMPNSAFETGQIDFVLDPERIAEKLTVILANQAPYRFPAEPSDDNPDFIQLLDLIRNEVGNDFSQYKIGTIKRRLSKRMSSLSISDLGEYLAALKKDSKELRSLAQEFLVSVTSFFRDAENFEFARESINEIVKLKNDGEEIRLWSAGCATGEEAFTLAILASEAVEETGKDLVIKVFATDLDTEAISKGRVGIYSDRDLTAVPETFREKYFNQRGELYEVKKSLRDRVVFARQDLIQSPPFVKLDLIACRNVIIYFEQNLQRKIFEIFHYALRPQGVLFLGKSEAINGANELFESINKKAKLFRKIHSKQRQLPPVMKPHAPLVEEGFPIRRTLTRAPSAMQVAQTQVLARYGIAGAIVTQDGTIDSIIGDVSPYLKIPAGAIAFKLQSLLPKFATVEFQLLMKKASKSNEIQISRSFRLFENSETKAQFQLQVSALESRDVASSLSPTLFLVSFNRSDIASKAVDMPNNVDADLELRAAELEQELAATKEHLQTVIEELGVTNEELQSTNEELSSTNEELQSSNEELETTNEEFQSTNEELSTVNDELNVKSKELRAAYSDLENIQVSIGVPMLVVDESLRLQRFNPSTTEIFDINLTDIGRNLSKLSSRCEIESFSSRVKSVIETGHAQEHRVEAYRAVYQMRITARKDENHRTIGAVILFFNNTELILAEQNLRQSDRRMRGVIDGTSSLIFLKDMSGKYLSVNEAFLNFFGLTESEVIGQTDRQLFSDSFSNQLRNGDLEALLKRSRIERQEEFVSNEKRSSFLISRFPLIDQDGHSVYGVGSVAVDISTQVQTQMALAKSEALYRAVIEDQTVFVVRFNPQGTILFVNAAFIRYFGGISTDFVGHSFSRIVDPPDREQVKNELERLSGSKTVTQLEHRYSPYGSNPRWIRWINKAVLDEKNEIIEIQAVGFDVTESRQQTEQMVQREMLFSNIFTYTTDFLTVFRVTAQNELLLESFNRTVDDGGGYTYAQFLGRNVRDLVTSEHRTEILEKYRQCIMQKTAQIFDEELHMQGSTKYLSTTVIPVLNNFGIVERVVTLSRDVSKYKIAEAELNAAKAAAEIANESKSDFLASMSHELRSPLTVVIGMAELLKDAKLSPVEHDQVRSIQRSGKVLLTLIEDILDISKIEAGKTKFEFRNFSLKELVGDVQETFRMQADQKSISLDANLTNLDIDQFVGDADRIRQILTNFVSNAVKFTERGQVKISVSSVGHKATGRRLVRFEVKDSGIGIPEEHHSRIFKKFSQVDSGLGRRYGGSGLGLVISQRLTNLMHGQIGFQSEWNKGSTFWFELPLTIAKKSIEKQKISKPTQRLNGRPTAPISAKILAVDDSPDNRMLLDLLLKRLGHQCRIVDSGAEAIEAIQKDNYDLILMDVQMPGMDGYESTTRIRRLDHPNHALPIIALTANAMVGDSEKCFDAGMNDYVTKPINSDLLRGVIEKWATDSSGTKGLQ